MDLFYEYCTNLPLYPAVQAHFREHRPPMLGPRLCATRVKRQRGAHCLGVL